MCCGRAVSTNSGVEVGAPGDEIGITPGMIDAGVEELSLCEQQDSYLSIAQSVYVAMERYRRLEAAQKSS